MNISIYSLSCPVSNSIRYIGKTKNIQDRFAHHLNDSRHTRKTTWIKKLRSKGLKPIIEVLDAIDDSEWEFWEKHYISLYKSWGFELTNHTDGGKGVTNATPDTKLKMRNAQLGKKHTPEAKEKQRLKQIGVIPSLITREKLRQANLGKKQPLDAIAKTVAANIGRKNTEEMKRKLSQKFKGTPRDPLAVKKMAETNRKPVLQYSLLGDFIAEYPSLKSAKEALNGNNGLSGCLKGKAKTWLGFKWKYKEKK